MRKAYAKIVDSQAVDQALFEESQTPEDETWLPIEVEIADYNITTHREVGRYDVVEENRVFRRRRIEQIPVTAAMVKEECQRRVIAATGATDLNSCLIKQLNANMRAAELIRIKQDRDWTTEEAAEAGALESLAAAIKRLRAKSNEIEAMDPMPIDFRSDTYWAA